MAYDETLVMRIREHLAMTADVTEMKMFGGWGLTVHGNMAVGVMAQDLIVRVGPHGFDGALQRPGARPFDFTGRPMTGWVFVDGASVADPEALHGWVDLGVSFATSLPSKSGTVGSERQAPR